MVLSVLESVGNDAAISDDGSAATTCGAAVDAAGRPNAGLGRLAASQPATVGPAVSPAAWLMGDSRRLAA